MMLVRRCVAIGLLSSILLSSVACTNSDEETVREPIEEILSGLPTATPIVFPTTLPTATPIPTSTPAPTTTPVPTATPQPTATPITFPPAPTPVSIPPTPVLQKSTSLSDVYRASVPDSGCIYIGDLSLGYFRVRPGSSTEQEEDLDRVFYMIRDSVHSSYLREGSLVSKSASVDNQTDRDSWDEEPLARGCEGKLTRWIYG